MTLEIKVGPPHVAVHCGYTLMVSAVDGQIASASESGL